MITVHHLENSRSQRVLWLLEELGVPYEVRRYERDKRTMLAPPELLAVHPLGKSPVITDDGRTVAETGAIVEYLTERYDEAHRLVPAPGSEARLRYTYWLHFAEGSAMPPLVMTLVFRGLPSSVPALVGRALPWTRWGRRPQTRIRLELHWALSCLAKPFDPASHSTDLAVETQTRNGF